MIEEFPFFTIFLWLSIATIALLTAYIVVPHVYKKLAWKRIHGRLKNSQAIYLTFDDGPSPGNTEKLLDLLDEYQIKATFFLRGDLVERHPALAQRIQQASHGIGQHGYAHPHGWKTGPLKTLRDLRKMDAVFEAAGIQTTLYRPPFGKLNLVHLLYLPRTGKQLILWNLDPKDYSQPSASVIAQHIMDRSSAGSVILLHDGRVSAGNTNAAVTLDAIKLLKDFFQKNAERMKRFE